jgi:hypothetical protein
MPTLVAGMPLALRNHPPSENPKSEQVVEFIDRKTGLPDDRPQCPARNLTMIGNREAAMRWRLPAEDYVAATLPIDFVANLRQRGHDFAP